jgi:hypothetical protein
MPVSPSSLSSSAPAGNLFAGTDWTDPSKASGAAGQAAGNLFGQGGDLMKSGQFDLGAVISRLQKLLSGDPGTVDQAIQPQAQGVTSAYETARRNIAQFTPRGGGQSGAITQSRLSEASDIGSLRASAVNSASSQLAQIGQNLLGTGAQLESASVGQMLSLVQDAIKQQGDNRSFWSGIGTAIGKLALGVGLGVATGGASVPVSIGDAISGSNNA